MTSIPADLSAPVCYLFRVDRRGCFLCMCMSVLCYVYYCMVLSAQMCAYIIGRDRNVDIVLSSVIIMSMNDLINAWTTVLNAHISLHCKTQGWKYIDNDNIRKDC